MVSWRSGAQTEDGAAAAAVSSDLSGAEATVVARAIADPLQFAPLYMEYVDQIHRYCYRRLTTREQAEDATSLVFERAIRALPTWRGGSFRAWLFAIAYHVVMDDYRQRRSNLPYDCDDEIEDPAPGPEEIAIVADEQRLLQALLPLLTTDQRSVVELRLSGLQSVEVAQILGRTPESVRTLQRRAIDRLQVMLGIPAQTRDQRDA